MRGPGLAESDAVTFLLYSQFMAPKGQNNSKFSSFLELIPILSLCYIQSAPGLAINSLGKQHVPHANFLKMIFNFCK